MRIPYSPRHKRTRAERKRDLADVAALHVAGNTQQEIADWISSHRPYKLDRSQIAYDLKELQSQWQQKSTKTIRRAGVEEVVRINQIERLAWDCWDRSIGEVVRVRHRKGTRAVTVCASLVVNHNAQSNGRRCFHLPKTLIANPRKANRVGSR